MLYFNLNKETGNKIILNRMAFVYPIYELILDQKGSMVRILCTKA